MSRRSPHCLRSKRKENGLTQEEVAFLLGTNTGTQVSQYEGLRRQPGIETMLAYQAIFGEPVEKLSPVLNEKVVEKTKDRAQALLEQLDDREANERKRQLLKSIIARKTVEPEILPWQTKALTPA